MESLRLKPDEAFVIRSLAGHIVAGTATDQETKELLTFSRSLTELGLKKG